MSPLGSGPEVLLPPAAWPAVPVLIEGMAGSGRRTWAEYLLAAHRARPVMVRWCAATLSVDEARSLGQEWFAVRSRAPRWAVVRLDQASAAAQNALLKTLEELPAGCRVILVGQRRRVLGTVRSRCRVVRLVPGPAESEIEFVAEQVGVGYGEAAQAVSAARGRPALAVVLAGQSEAASRAHSLVAAALSGDRSAVGTALADREMDWAAVRSWLVRWAAAEHPPRLGVLRAARDTCDARLAVRTATDRLLR